MKSMCCLPFNPFGKSKCDRIHAGLCIQGFVIVNPNVRGYFPQPLFGPVDVDQESGNPGCLVNQTGKHCRWQMEKDLDCNYNIIVRSGQGLPGKKIEFFKSD